jgi:hypothetical protein
LRKQDFEGAKKWLSFIKTRNCLVQKQQDTLITYTGMVQYQSNRKYFKKAIELGLSMDMDLAVAKLNLAGVAMSRRRKLEATNLLMKPEN